MVKIGELIRSQRISDNLKVEDVAKELRIRKKYVIAIENDDPNSFTSKAYYIGYLKQYLKLLNFDYKNISFPNDMGKKQSLSIPSPIIEYLSPNISLTIIAIILMIIIYNLSNYFIDKNIIDQIILETTAKNKPL